MINICPTTLFSSLAHFCELGLELEKLAVYSAILVKFIPRREEVGQLMTLTNERGCNFGVKRGFVRAMMEMYYAINQNYGQHFSNLINLVI